jgi:dTDP-4-amino-4,6-dideoxy-D-glucose acyltransferase
MSFYSEDELHALGLASVGTDVRISRQASIHGANRITIGDHSRIDDFCVLSAGAGGIRIGRHVHIAVHCALIGHGRIELHDYAGLSSRVTIYSSNDDYSGAHMSNPTVPAEYTHVTHAPVTLGRHVIVGSGSVILPGCTLHEGCGVGSLSLVRADCEPFGMYFGAPVRRIGERQRTMIALGDRLEAALCR